MPTSKFNYKITKNNLTSAFEHSKSVSTSQGNIHGLVHHYKQVINSLILKEILNVGKTAYSPPKFMFPSNAHRHSVK